jgi:hypothetical protein
MNWIGSVKSVSYSALLCFACLGCGAGDSETGEKADPSSRPLSENLKEAVQEFDELAFCVTEGAGVATMKPIFDRMVIVMNGIPASIQESGLSQSDQSKLKSSIEEAIATCQESTLTSEADYQRLCKDLAKPLKAITKIAQQ